jgi:hypothetical protein
MSHARDDTAEAVAEAVFTLERSTTRQLLSN